MNDSTCPAPCPCPPLPASKAAQDEALARLAKALGHPARVAIIRHLCRAEACIVGEIVSELPLAASTVSAHLKHLKNAGIIRGEVEGPRICYCVEPTSLELLKGLIDALAPHV